MYNCYMRLNTSFILKYINFTLYRRLNGHLLKIPVLGSIKVGVSNEKWMSGLLQEINKLKKIKSFLDIGANLGQTLIKVKTINPETFYHAFEPNYLCVFYLHNLIQKNNLRNTFIYPVGIFQKDTLLELQGKNDFDLGSTIFPEYAETKTLKSKLTPFYSYSTLQDSLNISPLEILKVDTEGSELEVIRSLEELISKEKPLILIEVLKYNEKDYKKIQRDDDLFKIFSNLNYAVFRINKDENGSFLNINEVNSLGKYTSNKYADHVVIHKSKLDIYSKLIE
jgi:FkbM family methyltransferase